MDFFSLGWVDAVLLGLLGLSALVGLLRGFIFELLSLLGWIVAYFAAQWFTPLLAAHIPVGQPGSGLNHGATFACAFVAALIIWGLLARLVRMLIRATPLSLPDRVLGAGFGLARGLVVLLAVATVVGLTPLAKSVAWQRSQGATWLQAGLRGLKPVLPVEVSQHLPA
jgi:membrane protein required for colicin V production